MMDYNDFIKSKIKKIVDSGFDINENQLNTNLFDFQKKIVKQALKKGKYAIFANTGLGKTLMQLSWAEQVQTHTNGLVLILAPLAVSKQTINEGVKFGINVQKYTNQTEKGIYITNYEQLNNINTKLFSGIVLDESSIIKNFIGKIKTQIIESFKFTPYKLACTATPSPNDYVELGNHTEFLDIMSRLEMLSMYFIHDASNTGDWRLKKHAKDEFFKFINSWAIMISNPKDLGFNGDAYTLPDINYFESKIITENKGESLFNDIAISATGFNAEVRRTMDKRLQKTASIANKTNEPFVIWIKHNEEGKKLLELIPDSVEVKGSDSMEKKEANLIGFGQGKFRVLITKTKIAGFGMNWQHCRNQIFATVDFSFESLYQAIRRSYRFGQTKEVNIYIITTDTMTNVIKSIRKKEKAFTIMQEKMTEFINAKPEELIKENKDYKEVVTDDYTLKKGDSVQLIKAIPDESVGFSVFSPPFADLYTYSNNIEDMGNSSTHEEFYKHFEYLVEDLFRILKQGRNIAVHCMDIPTKKSKDGYIGLKDFSGDLIKIFESKGFIYHCRITIWKDPVVAMQRTKALGLLHKQVKKDSTKSRVGFPDYVLVFRKDGERSEPVSQKDIPVDLWQKYASPVWMDINQSDTISFRMARDIEDEKHICPLQIEVIERLIHLYTNKGDVVFSPFLGVGSEIYQAIKMNRKGYGIELKESYFNQAVSNVNSAMYERSQLSLL